MFKVTWLIYVDRGRLARFNLTNFRQHALQLKKIQTSEYFQLSIAHTRFCILKENISFIN